MRQPTAPLRVYMEALHRPTVIGRRRRRWPRHMVLDAVILVGLLSGIIPAVLFTLFDQVWWLLRLLHG